MWRVGSGLREPPKVAACHGSDNDLWLICGYKVVFTVPIEEYFEFGQVTQRVR